MTANKILELFGLPASGKAGARWSAALRKQRCPFLGRKCLKVRKSQPEVSIGTCSVQYGREGKQVLICPHRFLERRQVFTDCLQLHHKIETFEHLGKHLVLVIQDHLFEYMARQFQMEHLERADVGNPLQIHVYRLDEGKSGCRLALTNRYSTDTQGVAACLGLQASPKIQLQAILGELERKLSKRTLFTVGESLPVLGKKIVEE